MKIILIDNYDSFTFNLYHYISVFSQNVDVIRNDKINSKTKLITLTHMSNVTGSITNIDKVKDIAKINVAYPRLACTSKI